MALQCDNDDSLRAQRMTAEEARAVIDLWQRERAEQAGLTDKPAVPDMAEALDITTEDVQRLLQAVREGASVEAHFAEQGRHFAELRRQRAAQEAADQCLGARAFGIIVVLLITLSLALWLFVLLYDHSL